MSEFVAASSASPCARFVLSHGTFSAPIFRSSVGCVYRANMRVDEWPEIAITV